MHDPVDLIAAKRGFTESLGKARPHAEIVGQRNMVGMQDSSGGNGFRSGSAVLCRCDETSVGNKADSRQDAYNDNNSQQLDQ